LTEEQKLSDLKEAMSIVQFKAIVALLAGDYVNTNATAKEITTERQYSHSHYYGQERYHILSLQYDGDIVLEQNDKGEKYQQRVTLESAEVEPLLRQLLTWHLAKAAETKKTDTWDSDPFGDDELGKPDGMVIFSLNDGSFSITAEKFSTESEESPNDGPIII
jgi:hypothetical protein